MIEVLNIRNIIVFAFVTIRPFGSQKIKFIRKYKCFWVLISKFPQNFSFYILRLILAMVLDFVKCVLLRQTRIN